METTTNKLLNEIRVFLKETGMSPTYFGHLAVRNTSLVPRLEAGGTVKLTTAERVRDYIKKKKRNGTR